MVLGAHDRLNDKLIALGIIPVLVLHIDPFDALVPPLINFSLITTKLSAPEDPLPRLLDDVLRLEIPANLEAVLCQNELELICADLAVVLQSFEVG